jgi:hypothetical protein
MNAPENLEAEVARVMPQVPLEQTLVLRATRKVSEQIDAATQAS